jgi:hypothetical protein
MEFDATIWRAACEVGSKTWNLCTNIAFALGPKKTTGELDRVIRSQDLPDTIWLLTSGPALNTRTLALVAIWLLLYLKNIYIFYTDLSFSCEYYGWAQRGVYKMREKNTCIRTYMHINIHIFIFLIIWVSVNSNIYFGGGGDLILCEICCSSINIGFYVNST